MATWPQRCKTNAINDIILNNTFVNVYYARNMRHKYIIINIMLPSHITRIMLLNMLFFMFT